LTHNELRACSKVAERQIVNKTSQFYPMRFHSAQMAIKLLNKEKSLSSSIAIWSADLRCF
jgi:hypothetical protein